MAHSRCCKYCELYFPDDGEWLECPCCREPTHESFHAPMTSEEAASLKRHADFGWWLLEHDRL